jgi:hypothetical protein
LIPWHILYPCKLYTLTFSYPDEEYTLTMSIPWRVDLDPDEYFFCNSSKALLATLKNTIAWTNVDSDDYP